jgi:hypothetical protein
VIPFGAAEKKSDQNYLLGAIVSNRDPSFAKIFSSWIFSLSEEEWSDNHETMKKIRAARRLLEKAIPGFEATIASERVNVLDATLTPLSRKKGQWSSPLPGLQIISDWAIPTGATLESCVFNLLENSR